jgi:pimeloyl-ACP methyl ester carboxylesterase
MSGAEFTSQLARKQKNPLKRISREGETDEVASALKETLYKWHLTALEKAMYGKRVFIETAQVDPREIPEEKDPRFLNITGGWGRGPESEGEVKTLTYAIGKKGAEIDLISLPGHGHTSELPGGWGKELNGETDFERASQIVAAYIKQELKADQRPLIITAWSMGGVTALKVTANHPELVDRLILIDTPTFPLEFKKLALRFPLYSTFHKGVKKEKPTPTDFKRPGLDIFVARLKQRNLPQGIPLDVVEQTAKSLCQQDLAADGTLKKVTKHKIPILLLHGENDFVVPREQMHKLEEEIRKQGGNIERIMIPGAGHALPNEKPREVGEIIKNWLENLKSH